MNILITGGAGMIGSHCAEHFAGNTHNKVIVYDNLMRSRIFASKKKSVEYNWHYLHQYKNIAFWKNDIRDEKTLEKCFKKHQPDVVIHAAAQPGIRFSLEHPHEDFTINCTGTVNVLDMLRRYNPKGTFIYCSTNKVYGEQVNKIPLGETKTRHTFKGTAGVSESCSIDHTGHTPYGVSKLAGDLFVQDYAHTYGLKTGVFRMSCIYGTRQFGFEDQGWIAWFAICYLLGNKITIYGDGKQVRDVLWVDDMLDAYERFIESPLRHGVFNLGGGKDFSISLLDLLSILQEITGKKIKTSFKGWRRFDQKVYISDISKVKKTLKWKPSVTPREGVERIVTWLEHNRGLFV